MPIPSNANKILSPPTAFIGADPGAAGGIAVIGSEGVLLHSLGNATDKQTVEFLRFIPQPCFAVIEKNSGYVGGEGNPGSAMFKFGVSTGKLLGCLTALGIPHEEITPGQWQNALGVPRRAKNEGKAEFKRRLKARAEQLFPGVEGITLKTCDALLIACYCQRKMTGTL